jgi:hypothetical protein
MRIYNDIKEIHSDYVNLCLNNEYYLDYCIITLFKYQKYNDDYYTKYFAQFGIDKFTYSDIIKDDNDFLDFFMGV